MGLDGLQTKSDLKRWINRNIPASTGADSGIASDESGLKVIRGIVTTTSTTPAYGEGFTVAVNGTGNITVTFDAPFSDLPAVIATAEGAGDFACQVNSPSASSVQILRRNGGTLWDGYLHFYAIGPA